MLLILCILKGGFVRCAFIVGVARIVGGKNFNRGLAESGTLLGTKSMKKKKKSLDYLVHP